MAIAIITQYVYESKLKTEKSASVQGLFLSAHHVVERRGEGPPFFPLKRKVGGWNAKYNLWCKFV
jgi:hypothetical protein